MNYSKEEIKQMLEKLLNSAKKASEFVSKTQNLKYVRDNLGEKLKVYAKHLQTLYVFLIIIVVLSPFVVWFDIWAFGREIYREILYSYMGVERVTDRLVSFFGIFFTAAIAVLAHFCKPYLFPVFLDIDADIFGLTEKGKNLSNYELKVHVRMQRNPAVVIILGVLIVGFIVVGSIMRGNIIAALLGVSSVWVAIAIMLAFLFIEIAILSPLFFALLLVFRKFKYWIVNRQFYSKLKHAVHYDHIAGLNFNNVFVQELLLKQKMTVNAEQSVFRFKFRDASSDDYSASVNEDILVRIYESSE